MTTRRRVLFFAETVTLAHAARPFVLARALDRDAKDATQASQPRYAHLFNVRDLRVSIDPTRAIQRGARKGQRSTASTRLLATVSRILTPYGASNRKCSSAAFTFRWPAGRGWP